MRLKHQVNPSHLNESVPNSHRYRHAKYSVWTIYDGELKRGSPFCTMRHMCKGFLDSIWYLNLYSCMSTRPNGIIEAQRESELEIQLICA